MATPSDPHATAPRRELAAIMFSDIAGYTAIMARDEQEGLKARDSHRELLHTILPRFNGRLLGDLGDGALSSFHSAIDAVNCARAFQAATGNDPQFRIRVGIHVGDVLFADNTVLGDGVNIASRIQALAPPGGTCISERVYEEIRNKPEFEVKDLGEQQLKNVPRPIRVYALAAPGSTGERLIQPSTAAAPREGKRIPWVALAGAVAIAGLLYLAVTLKPWLSNPSAPKAGVPHTIRSIAVLPLDNFSGDPKQEYFADGMTDELTSDLAKISALRVTSRGSVMQFKGAQRPPTPEIAKLLNVDAVVEGSVLRVGDRVRITAQLIDAPADKHLWADSYERDSRDVLALQDELASAIAKEIDIQLTPGEQARLTSAPSVNPAAHDAYLEGRYFFSRPTDENLKKALAQFEDAIRLDPNFAPAYSGLSDAYIWAGSGEGVFTAAEGMPKAKAAADRAIQLDDNSAEAHASLADFKFAYEFDWAGSEREFQRAIELNPSYAYAHDQYGEMLAYQGRLDEALAQNRRAVELDPFGFLVSMDMVYTLAWQGKYEAAKDLSRKALDLDPTNWVAQWEIGWTDIQAGKISDAIPELQKADAMVESPLGLPHGSGTPMERQATALRPSR